METTKLSTKGQVILPKSIRDAKKWTPGMEFEVEETREGVLLRPKSRFPRTRIEDVAGMLQYKGKAKTIEEMDEAIAKEIRERFARGRY